TTIRRPAATSGRERLRSGESVRICRLSTPTPTYARCSDLIAFEPLGAPDFGIFLLTARKTAATTISRGAEIASLEKTEATQKAAGRVSAEAGLTAGSGKRRDEADTSRISSAERFVSAVLRLFLPRAARHRGHTMAASIFSCRGCGVAGRVCDLCASLCVL